MTRSFDVCFFHREWRRFPVSCPILLLIRSSVSFVNTFTLLVVRTTMATTLLKSSLGPLRRVVPQPLFPLQASSLSSVLSVSPSSNCSFSTTTTPASSVKGEITTKKLVEALVETHALKKNQAEEILTTVFDSIVEVSPCHCCCRLDLLCGFLFFYPHPIPSSSYSSYNHFYFRLSVMATQLKSAALVPLKDMYPNPRKRLIRKRCSLLMFPAKIEFVSSHTRLSRPLLSQRDLRCLEQTNGSNSIQLGCAEREPVNGE